MRKRPVLLPLTCLTCLVIGFVTGKRFAERSPSAEMLTSEQTNRNLFQQQTEQLQIELQSKEQQLEKISEELASVQEDMATAVTLPDPSDWLDAMRPPLVTNMTQARALFDDAIADQDFESIWRIGFDLLSMGEGAYPTLDEFFETFADEFYGGKLSSPLWRLPELYQGILLRECAEHESALLDYMGYLSSRESQDLPDLLADFRTDLLEGPMTPLLLGFNEGRDPAKLQQLLDYYEQRVDKSSSGTFTNREIILALSHIPGDRCAALLGSLFPKVSSARRLDIVRALVFNGSSTAIQELRALQGEVRTQVLKRAVEDGLRLCER